MSVRRASSWNFRLTVGRIASVVLGVTVALTVIETSLRIAGWPTPGLYIDGNGPVSLREAGASGGAFPPLTRGVLRHYDYSVSWNVNSHGFRDGEDQPKVLGEWRIAVVGDSFTAGAGVDESKRFTDIFKLGIQKHNAGVTVWNVSAPLCGTACEEAMLKYVDQTYQLDEVILAFYSGNDLEENDSWFATGSATAAGIAKDLAPTFRDWLRNHSRLASFVWINGIRAGASFRPPGVYAKADFDRYWPNTERSLQLFRKDVGERRLTILYLPSQSEWDDDAWSTLRSRYQAPEDARYLVRDAVSKWSHENKVSFIDATDSLRTCRPASKCMFPVDPHWNNQGHLLVAEAMLAQMTSIGDRK